MKFFCLSILSLFLFGCNFNQGKDLDSFLLNKNTEQEQKISSKNNWISQNFKIDCEWFDLERVVDGDTLIVQDEKDRIRVRMIGIDTPESKRKGTAIQPFAIEAGRKLKLLLEDETRVCLIEDEVGDKYDVYGRKLAYVFTQEGQDLNAEMIKSGLARGYFGFPFERKSEFREYENKAKEAELGVWE